MLYLSNSSRVSMTSAGDVDNTNRNYGLPGWSSMENLEAVANNYSIVDAFEDDYVSWTTNFYKNCDITFGEKHVVFSSTCSQNQLKNHHHVFFPELEPQKTNLKHTKKIQPIYLNFH